MPTVQVLDIFTSVPGGMLRALATQVSSEWLPVSVAAGLWLLGETPLMVQVPKLSYWYYCFLNTKKRA
jgi:hypothetical protein